MSFHDDQIRSAFENLMERRQRTTNVPAALARVKQHQPWFRRFALPMAIGVIGASTAVVLLAVFAWSDSDTTTIEPPDFATQSTGQTESPNLLIANSDEDAIRLYVEDRGDSYEGDCDTATEPGLCSTPKPAEDGGGRVYALTDSTTGEAVEDLFVLDDGSTSTRVVDARPVGYSLQTGLWEYGVSAGSVEWTTPGNHTTIFLTEGPDGLVYSYAEQVFGDVYVGVNELPQSPEDFSINGPCDASLLHIDSETGETTEIANGFNPRLSGDGRFLAYETSTFQGESPDTLEQCIFGSTLVIRDLFDGTERSSELVDSNDDETHVISRWAWSPGSLKIAVTTGQIGTNDDSETRIIEVFSAGPMDIVDLEETPPELTTNTQSRLSHWDGDDLIVAFEAEDFSSIKHGRYNGDGFFQSVVEPDGEPPNDIESVSNREWHDIITNTPGIEVLDEVDGKPRLVRFGNSHGLVDFSAETMFNVGDLDEDADDEQVFALRNPDGAGFTGVLVYTMGVDGPVLFGPSTFYHDFPQVASSVERSSEEWAPNRYNSLAITEEIGEDGDGATSRRVRTYAMPNSLLEVVNDTE